MHTLVFDIETRSTVDLGDTGTHIYAAHPGTEVQVLAYCIDDDPIQTWRPGDAVPTEFFYAAQHPDWRVVVHNAAFEFHIMQHILVPLYGFPEIPLERYSCTMARANAVSLPGALKKLAAACNFEHRKDEKGARRMLKMTKPRKPKKGEPTDAVLWHEEPEDLQQLGSYVGSDVAATREADQCLPELIENEHKVWLLDQKINNAGFHFDDALARAAGKIAVAAIPRINAEMIRLTNGEVTSFTQRARIVAWLAKQGVAVDKLQKAGVEELRHQDGLPEHVQRVLELRLLGAQVGAAKADALLQRRGADGRIRGSFVYHAAGPGRWSSRGAQVHNLKRPEQKDVEKAVEVIGRGDLEYARSLYDNPLSVIGDVIRAMVIAAPGHTLIGGDYSGIEARITAWLAGQEDKLDVFRAFDAGTGPDPYLVAAAKIFRLDPQRLALEFAAGDPVAREKRQIGKGAELAFGFQGGVNAYKRFLPQGAPATQTQAIWEARAGEVDGTKAFADVATVFDDREIERIKDAWRNAHPHICRMWANLERAAHWAVNRPGSTVTCGKFKFMCDSSPFLWLRLPSGRTLAYPHARIIRAYRFDTKLVEHPHGQERLVFKDNANGRWHDVEIYGGLLTENVVQATARDLLAEAMLRLDRSGYKIVLHVHDEIAVEAAANGADFNKVRFAKLMMQAPQWATGLPIKVSTWISERYTK